jgi:hypothetical protein
MSTTEDHPARLTFSSYRTRAGAIKLAIAITVYAAIAFLAMVYGAPFFVERERVGLVFSVIGLFYATVLAVKHGVTVDVVRRTVTRHDGLFVSFLRKHEPLGDPKRVVVLRSNPSRKHWSPAYFVMLDDRELIRTGTYRCARHWAGALARQLGAELVSHGLSDKVGLDVGCPGTSLRAWLEAHPGSVTRPGPVPPSLGAELREGEIVLSRPYEKWYLGLLSGCAWILIGIVGIATLLTIMANTLDAGGSVTLRVVAFHVCAFFVMIAIPLAVVLLRWYGRRHGRTLLRATWAGLDVARWGLVPVHSIVRWDEVEELVVEQSSSSTEDALRVVAMAGERRLVLCDGLKRGGAAWLHGALTWVVESRTPAARAAALVPFVGAAPMTRAGDGEAVVLTARTRGRPAPGAVLGLAPVDIVRFARLGAQRTSSLGHPVQVTRFIADRSRNVVRATVALPPTLLTRNIAIALEAILEARIAIGREGEGPIPMELELDHRGRDGSRQTLRWPFVVAALDLRHEALDLAFSLGRALGLERYAVPVNDQDLLELTLLRRSEVDGADPYRGSARTAEVLAIPPPGEPIDMAAATPPARPEPAPASLLRRTLAAMDQTVTRVRVAAGAWVVLVVVAVAFLASTTPLLVDREGYPRDVEHGGPSWSRAIVRPVTKGQPVLAPTEVRRYYTLGTVEEDGHDGTTLVLFANGARVRVPTTALRQDTVRAGTMAQVLYNGEWCKARMVERLSDGRFRVELLEEQSLPVLVAPDEVKLFSF